jgi:uncharacterized damage-inducible protein DinB
MKRGSLLLMAACGIAHAQTPGPLAIEAKFPWTVVRDNLMKMAQKMPAENYTFKPTAEIESFGQRIAHIAGANLSICQGIKSGDQQMRRTAGPRPNPMSKEEMIALLRQAATACDAVFDSLSDAAAMEKISSRLGGPFPPEPMRTKLSTLYNMTRHSNEMYGYMCVYLRLKGIVPPSSAPE